MNCRCGANMISAENGTLLFCPFCEHIEPVKPSSAAPCRERILPGLQPGRQEVKVKELEKAIVRRIVDGLQRRGYTVLQIGQHIAKGSGTSLGCPDLMATPCRENNFKGLEVKCPGYSPSDVRPEQQALAVRGEIAIVTSIDEALAILETNHTKGK